MINQIYADEVSNLYVANGLVRLELSTYTLEGDGQIKRAPAGGLLLHLNAFIGLQAQMEKVIEKMIADGILTVNKESSSSTAIPTPNPIVTKNKPKTISGKPLKKP